MRIERSLLVLVLHATRGMYLVLAAPLCDQLTFVDPVTSVEHHCSELCEVLLDGYKEYCEAYCPKYKGCIESSRRVKQVVTSTSTSATTLTLEPARFSVQSNIIFGACVTTVGFCVVIIVAATAVRRRCIRSKLQRRNADINRCIASGLKVDADCKLKSSTIQSPIYLASPKQGIGLSVGIKDESSISAPKERGTETKSLLP